ncbi:ADAM 17-like protease isoform X2 [Centruroides sculpturatus]|uniref:ADAM 17-like protease isoform X2 n=1 Tax=Centruroides sculpturatus TaxID=218467 RepID=UPI000C6CC94D|nr:ADAM 17-like protease isoform X2 [Centruroides sculpturatus]
MIVYMYVPIYLIALFVISGDNIQALSNAQLKYFELLDAADVSHTITKRGIHPSYHRYNTIKEVSFKALGRYFRLILNPTQGLLSSRFKAYTVDGLGNKQPVWVDKNQFFEGRVFGEKNSEVTAHIDDGLITAAIRTPEDTYIIEPSWRHLLEDNNSSMIIYRGSDVKFSWDSSHDDKNPLQSKKYPDPYRPKFCSYVREDGNSSEVYEDEILSDQCKKMNKRQAIDPYHWEPVQTRCSLLLVADYRFYENMGGSNLKGTINFLISLIDRVNKIFLETEWQDSEKQPGFRGMGFVIQEVMVHTEPSPVVNGEKHYNMADVSWNVRDLLEVFSRNVNHRWFCLAHLFTDQKFDGGILGLAYVGSPRHNSVGGICSPGYVKNGYTLYLNSGLSTSRNHYGQRVITREADLVTAHEFGHNWGSEHDPDIPDCSPDARHGGSYLMYTYSVSGYDPNNKKFSPCSIRSIRAVLLAKANKCFLKPEESFCGNSLVEEGEECDAGLIGSEDNDLCCDTNCRLREGVICSDKNAPCCRGCRLVQRREVCREAQPLACKQEAHCTGESPDCPPSPAQPNKTLCLDKGQCLAGECIPFCETRDRLYCLCDREEDACKRCCRRTQNDTCDPIEPIEILRDGTPCIHGYCDKGHCKKTVQDIVERFWDRIEDININSVLKFLNDNIVGTVVVISVIIWVPASCLISYVDRKRRKEYKEVMERRSKRQNILPFQAPNDKNTKIIHISRRNHDNASLGHGMGGGMSHAGGDNYRYYSDRLYPRGSYRPAAAEMSYPHPYSHPDTKYNYNVRPQRYTHLRSSIGPADPRPLRVRPSIVEAYTAL